MFAVRIPLVLTLILTLTACSSITERQAKTLDLLKEAEQTASGAVKDAMQGLEGVIEQGKTVTEGVGEMVDDAKRRIDQVQSGVDLMMQGKEMIQGGVKGN